MRWIVRVTTWLLAAIGVRAVYERCSPRARQLRSPAGDVLDTAKTEAQAVTDHAKAVATELGAHVKTAAGHVVAEARTKADEISGGSEERSDRPIESPRL
jgi:hypothetical protein